MGLFGRLFGKRETPKENIAMYRGPKTVHAVPGTEDATFLKRACALLAIELDEIDLSLDLQADYDCDELDVLELIQIAEDVYTVSLMPNPFQANDAERAIKKFHTLSDIVDIAKAKRNI